MSFFSAVAMSLDLIILEESLHSYAVSSSSKNGKRDQPIWESLAIWCTSLSFWMILAISSKRTVWARMTAPALPKLVGTYTDPLGLRTDIMSLMMWSTLKLRVTALWGMGLDNLERVSDT